MTAHKPGDPTTINRLYGRSKGKPLRAGQQDLVDQLLPQIAVPLEGPVTAERLFGDQYHWSVLAAGRFQLPYCTMAATMGANVRVGLEDNLFLGKGQLAPSNAALVAKIRHILEELSIDIASADEARVMLGTKGGANVKF